MGKAWERTAEGDPSGGDDTVGVAVVNYRMPRLRSPAEVIANAHKIRQMIEGMKLGLPGLDLVVFPEHSTHGVPYGGDEGWHATLPAPAPETEVLAQACRNAAVWGVFSMGGGHPTMVLMNRLGEIVQTCRGTTPWTPEAGVAEGPRGLKVGLVICGDGHDAEVFGKVARQGAELVVRCQGDGQPTRQDAQALMSRAMIQASASLTYVAMAHAAGSDGVALYPGHSAIIGFDGRTLAECGDEEYGVRYACLSKRQVRSARGAAQPLARP